MGNINPKFLFQSLREKYPSTEFFLVRVFLYLFSPITGRYRSEKTPYLGTFHEVNTFLHTVREPCKQRKLDFNDAKETFDLI